MRARLLQPLSPLLALVIGAACAREAASPRGDGAPCDAETACAGDRLCVDGACVARGRAPEPATEPLAPPVWLDVVAPHEPDGADVPDARDVTEPTDALDDADAVEVASELRIVLGPHDALADPSDTRLGLAVGQGAAREVEVPEAATAIALEVVPSVPAGLPGACGWYEAALWIPEPGGAFAAAPTWRSPPLLVATLTDVAQVPLPERVPLPPGPLRFGLVYHGPCEASFAPWIAMDASGLTADSWVWAGVWIPGASLDLDGRWGLSLVVAVQLR